MSSLITHGLGIETVSEVGSISSSAVSGIPRYEPLIGQVDGVNLLFRTTVPYVANSTAVFVNGKLYRREWDDGWTETDPNSGLIGLKEAPFVGDDVQAFYIDRTPAPKMVEIQGILGAVFEVQSITGRVSSLDGIRAVVSGQEALVGVTTSAATVVGMVQASDVLVGRLEVH